MRSTTEPRNITKITEAGTNIAMPTPVGDGTHVAPRPSRRAKMMPRTAPTTSAPIAPGGSALKPFDRISAKPAHFRDIGEVRPALLPTIPYVSRSNGYIHETAAAPIGVATNCIIVRFLGDDPIM